METKARECFQEVRFLEASNEWEKDRKRVKKPSLTFSNGDFFGDIWGNGLVGVNTVRPTFIDLWGVGKEVHFSNSENERKKNNGWSL